MSRMFEHNADPETHVPGRPVVVVEDEQDGVRVRVTVGSAEAWLRATHGGRRLSLAFDEGDGEVDVEWSIRRAEWHPEPTMTGPFVQSQRPRR